MLLLKPISWIHHEKQSPEFISKINLLCLKCSTQSRNLTLWMELSQDITKSTDFFYLLQSLPQLWNENYIWMMKKNCRPTAFLWYFVTRGAIFCTSIRSCSTAISDRVVNTDVLAFRFSKVLNIFLWPRWVVYDINSE